MYITGPRRKLHFIVTQFILETFFPPKKASTGLSHVLLKETLKGSLGVRNRFRENLVLCILSDYKIMFLKNLVNLYVVVEMTNIQSGGV